MMAATPHGVGRKSVSALCQRVGGGTCAHRGSVDHKRLGVRDFTNFLLGLHVDIGLVVVPGGPNV